MPDFSERRRIMVDTQVRPSDVTKFPIIEALLSVPREAFLPDVHAEAAYAGQNIDLGGGRVVLDPRTLAKTLDSLDIRKEELVLDIGCAYGYSTAVVARLADTVVGLEQDTDMAAEAQATLSENDVDNAAVVDGSLSEGSAKNGPFDVILIEGGVEEVPEALTSQLKEGGRIAALFMDGALGAVRIGHMLNGIVNWRFAFNAAAPVLPGFERNRAFAL